MWSALLFCLYNIFHNLTKKNPNLNNIYQTDSVFFSKLFLNLFPFLMT